MEADRETESPASDGEQKPAPKGTIYLKEEHCKGCSYCVVFCPTNALAMGGRMNRKGYHLPELVAPEACNGCDMCGMFCPDFAIFGVNFKKLEKARGGGES
jgi:2-oxoglutarate ferredoxin oxidoreductase subunit delta